MKKILLVSHSQKYGGAEKCLHEAAVGLRNRGFLVIVMVPMNGELKTYLDKDKIDCIVFSYPWWVHFENEKRIYLLHTLKKSLSLIFRTLKFIQFLIKEKPEAVITNTITIPCSAVASKFMNINHYWFIHELGKEDHGLIFDFGFRFSVNLMNFCSNKIIINSEFVYRKYEKYFNRNKVVIIDIDVPKPKSTNKFELKAFDIKDDQVNLYIIGQIQPSKGQIQAVQVHQKLLENGYNSCLTIIGQRSNLDYYNLVFDLSSKIKNITIIDHSSNPFDLINGHCIGLVCSSNEAFGRVTIEYMKMKIPVIGSNQGNTPYLIKDKVSGFIYENENKIDLFEKIIYILNNYNYLGKILENAETFADENFNSDKYITSLEDSLN